LQEKEALLAAALPFISIFDERFLQEEYARRGQMKYFWNMPGRV